MRAGLESKGFGRASKSIEGLASKLSRRTARATRQVAERVRDRYKALAPNDTGALGDSPEVRPLVGASVQGHEVVIDRKALIESRRSRGGTIGRDSHRNEDMFYAAVVEFDENGDRPLRTSLAEETDKAIGEVAKEVRAVVTEAAR